MIHLLQFLLKLIARLEDGRENSRVAGSLLILGLWFVMSARLLGPRLGPGGLWLLWSGWLFVALGLYLFALRKTRDWRMRSGRNRRA